MVQCSISMRKANTFELTVAFRPAAAVESTRSNTYGDHGTSWTTQCDPGPERPWHRAAGVCRLVQHRHRDHHTVVRPFHINVPEEALVDLRRRIAATRWPDKRSEPDSGRFAS
jgi:hypothetical protein